jgi:RimJ/RimL family protein N-acetyltransferase
MLVFLETRRLVLRRLAVTDADNLFELDSDPEVMRFLTKGKPTPRPVIENEVLPRFLGYYGRQGGLGVWAAIEKATGEFIGWFALVRHDDAEGGAGTVELGYRLRSAAWGKGYAAEGSRAVIRKGFAELGAQRVIAQTMAVNLRSRRVMEKAGLRYVRTFHETWADPIEGTEYGEVEYALSKADWEESGATKAVAFRPLRRSDLPHLSTWLADAEVKKSWPVPNGLGELEATYGPRIDRSSATEVFVIEVGGEPAGIIQRYRTGAYADWAATLGQAAPSLVGVRTAGIDYLLGRGEHRHQGNGSRAIASFSARLLDDMPDVEAIVVSVQQANRPSWRALERAGYRRIWAGSLASDDPSDAGPAYLLVRWR